MAAQSGPDGLRLLKDKVFYAACDNQPQVIQDCLASLHPDVVKDVLHQCHEHWVSPSTPLIVAAWNGHLEVVELLVNEFNVDVNQRVRPSRHVDYNRWEMQLALLSAAWLGHLDIVKVLVRKGCDLSAANDCRETAMHVACRENHVDVMKYLEENGAVLDDRLMKWGLRSACIKGTAEVVEYLLSRGADPNVQYNKGNTILHYIAAFGTLDIVRLPLRHGARFTKNRHGRTPLMEAALYGCSDVVDFFLESVDFSELERIEALELLGARLARTNIEKAFMYVKQAMEERHKKPKAIHLKPRNPLPSLSNVHESQTLEELQIRQFDQHLFRLECLAILSRLVGPDGSRTASDFEDYSNELRSAGRHSEAIAVFLNGKKLAVKWPDRPCSIGLILLDAAFRFEQMIQVKIDTMFSDLEEILTLTVEAMEKDDTLRRMIFLYHFLWLSYILIALKLAQGQEEGRRLKRLTERFIRLSSCSPVLQKAVGLHWMRPEYLEHLDDLPYDLLISFLLQCGADVHVKDDNKDTALHIVAHISLDYQHGDMLYQITKTLLDAGALVGVRNNKGQTALDLASPELATKLMEQYPVSLKSLAASVVVEHKITYVGEVPEDLAEFIERH